MADETRVVCVRVRGRVQGVSYRVWTADVAEELGVAGWVRNRTDGTVEALFAGSADTVETMLERCREGPPAARVSSVVIEQEGGEAPKGFQILQTA